MEEPNGNNDTKKLATETLPPFPPLNELLPRLKEIGLPDNHIEGIEVIAKATEKYFGAEDVESVLMSLLGRYAPDEAMSAGKVPGWEFVRPRTA